MKWKVLIFSDDVYFSGKKHLVKDPKKAQWFDSYDEASARARDIVYLNLAGVSQVRLISEAYELA